MADSERIQALIDRISDAERTIAEAKRKLALLLGVGEASQPKKPSNGAHKDNSKSSSLTIRILQRLSDGPASLEEITKDTSEGENFEHQVLKSRRASTLTGLNHKKLVRNKGGIWQITEQGQEKLKEQSH